MARASQKRGGVLIGYINILAKQGVYLVYTPMLLSFLDKAEYGVFQAVNSLTLSLWMLSFGFASAYIRFYARCKVDGDELGIRRLNGLQALIFAVVSGVAISVGAVLSAAAPLMFSSKFTQDQVELSRWLIVILAASVAITLFSTVFDAYVTAREEFVFNRLRQLLFTLLQPIFALLFLQVGLGANGVALAQLLSNLLVACVTARYAMVRLGMRFTLKGVKWVHFAAMAGFSFWIFIAQISDTLNVNLPNVFLGGLSGAETVAVYSVALQIRSIFLSASLALVLVFTPEIHSMVARGSDRLVLTRAMVRCGRYEAIVSLYVFGGFALLGQYFIQIWAGDSFADAYWISLSIVAVTMVSIFQGLGQELRRAMNLHRVPNSVCLLLTGVNVLVVLVLTPRLGYWATALGYCLYVLLSDVIFLNWYYARRMGIDVRHFWRHMVRPLIAFSVSTAVCLSCARLLPVDSFMRFLSWGTVFTLVYSVLVVLVVLTGSERARLRRGIRMFAGRVRRQSFGA